MKTLQTILVALLMLNGTCAIAQIAVIKLDPPEMVCEKLYPATIVLKKGDTLNGYIKWINRQANQRRVIYYKTNTPKEKAITIRGIGIKTYTVNNQPYDNIIPEKDKAFIDGNVMLYRVLQGGISLYREYTDTIGLRFKAKNDTNYYDVCRKDSECNKLLYPYKGGVRHTNFEGFGYGFKFHETMSKLVEEYPELAKKVKDKEKGYRQMHRDKIILEYNEWYKQKQGLVK